MPTPTFSDCTVQMKFRVPEWMRDALHQSADRHMRNAQGEIIWRLAQSLEDHPVPDIEKSTKAEV